MAENNFIELVQEIALGLSLIISTWFYKKYKSYITALENEELLDQLCNNKQD